jgi:mono/diheme cytochrome c family protein
LPRNFYNLMTIRVIMNHIHNNTTIHRFSLHALLIIFLFAGVFTAHAEIDKANWTEGKNLFKGNCAACHNPKADGTGPALMGVTARWEAAGDFKGKTGKEWLNIWIRNWNDVTAAGYKYGVDMANSRPSAMNAFPNLKDADIEKMLLYIENPDAFGAPAVAVTPGAGQDAPKAGSPSGALYLFVIFLVILVAILIGVTNKLDKIVAEKNGEVIEGNKTPFYKNTKWIVAFVLLAIVFSGYKAVDWGVSLGRQQGYQPAQPIKYSHALHAGKHKIECQYCHSTAYKGKHANIPSVNTCMNCHKNISKGPQYGTEEIAKIYAAVGWDPATQTYDLSKAKPVEWVRIHNLPDHVYFNHAQHVNAGKVQCQTCHGSIENMEEVYQYAPLSMGWCINCHRQTDVQFGSNNYYSTYEKFHEQLKNKEISKVTVETIGGTECQKCHY